MGFDQLAGDGQADAGPVGIQPGGLLAPVEALKDEGPVLWGNAWPAVLHLQPDEGGVCTAAEDDLTALGRVAHRVLHDVPHRFGQGFGIAFDGHRGRKADV